MNLISHALISLLLNASETMKEEVTHALQEYRTEMERHKAIAPQYKNEAEYLTGQQAKYSEIARAAINKALRIFKNKAEETANQMTEQLRKHLHESINPEFRDKLSVISQFGLKPEKTEIEDLILLADSNQTALSALKTVLEKVESPYHLNFHTTGDYEKDIESVRSLGRNAFYIPSEYHAEGAEIFKGQQFTYTYPNGGQVGFTLTGTDILMRSSDFETTLIGIAGLKDVWTKDCSYSLADKAAEVELTAQQEINSQLQSEGLEPEPIITPESGISLDDTRSAEGVRIARELGQRNAEGAKTLQKAMDMYLK